MGRLAEEVLRRADIVEVVSQYLPLKKRGSNYWALSPFKPEKTPSFAVSPTKQIFKCFSSGKGGNVIRFVMEMEGLSYAEALRKLAEQYDIPLAEGDTSSKGRDQARELYLSVYREAVRYYQAAYREAPKAQAYLRQRGLSEATIEAFQIGYAPERWDSLTRHLMKLGFSVETLVAAGLSLESSGKVYDRFRGRVIFPILNERGEPLGLAGRLIAPDPEQPKYLNSPETPFYRKSEVLYGLFQARGAIRKADQAVLVEGYMDVVSLHQAGIATAIATAGTALSEAQLALLRRYTRRLYLALDADEAGQAATERHIEAALRAGFFVYVVPIPTGKDPDEYVQQVGAAGFLALLTEKAYSWVEFLAGRLGMEKPEQRYRLYERLGESLQALPDPYLRRVYAEEISQKLHIDPSFWEGFQRVSVPAAPAERRAHLTAEKELLRLWVSYPHATLYGQPLWQVMSRMLQSFVMADAEAEALRAALLEMPWSEASFEGALLIDHLPEPVQSLATTLLFLQPQLSPEWQKWEEAPLSEDLLTVFETNYRRLALARLQELLEENLSILAGLSESDPQYHEHLELHQALLEQRRALAASDGLILPYKSSP